MSSCLMLALALLLQGLPKNPRTNALAYLTQVTQRYVDAKSYHIEAVEETTTSNKLSRSWRKTLLMAIVAPGGKYHYEGRSGAGSAIIVCNGKKIWDYHIDEHDYTERAVAARRVGGNHIITGEEIPIMEAKSLVTQIKNLPVPLKAASFLPDETIEVGGRSVECRVVHFTTADFRTRKPGITTDETVWIDKARNLIVKTANHGNAYLMIGGPNVRVPIKREETTVYPVVRLNSPEPESSFTFSPPPDAKLVASFPEPWETWNNPADFVGKPAPEIHLRHKSKEVLLSAYRGKPVFIEFWATWCRPCMELTPRLKELYAETHGKGLVWIGIDKDKDTGTMEAYVRREHIPWPNYNDKDGSISKAFNCNAIPLGVLINPSGKVTFYGIGYPMAGLRAAIAKLGPKFRNAVMKSTNAGSGAAEP